MWDCLVEFGMAVFGLGPTWWFWGLAPGLRELGLVVYVACARDVGFWFYLFVLFSVIAFWVVGCLVLFMMFYQVGLFRAVAPLPMF